MADEKDKAKEQEKQNKSTIESMTEDSGIIGSWLGEVIGGGLAPITSSISTGLRKIPYIGEVVGVIADVALGIAETVIGLALNVVGGIFKLLGKGLTGIGGAISNAANRNMSDSDSKNAEKKKEKEKAKEKKKEKKKEKEKEKQKDKDLEKEKKPERRGIRDFFRDIAAGFRKQRQPEPKEQEIEMKDMAPEEEEKVQEQNVSQEKEKGEIKETVVEIIPAVEKKSREKEALIDNKFPEPIKEDLSLKNSIQSGERKLRENESLKNKSVKPLKTEKENEKELSEDAFDKRVNEANQRIRELNDQLKQSKKLSADEQKELAGHLAVKVLEDRINKEQETLQKLDSGSDSPLESKIRKAAENGKLDKLVETYQSRVQGELEKCKNPEDISRYTESNFQNREFMKLSKEVLKKPEKQENVNVNEKKVELSLSSPEKKEISFGMGPK